MVTSPKSLRPGWNETAVTRKKNLRQWIEKIHLFLYPPKYVKINTAVAVSKEIIEKFKSRDCNMWHHKMKAMLNLNSKLQLKLGL